MRRARSKRDATGRASYHALTTEIGKRSVMPAAIDENALLKRVTVDPERCGSRPTIRGMRIRVSDVLDMLATGETAETILTEYPYLEADDLKAALLYGARATDHRIVGAA
jgi:uncharacterized protein (DUF433 family)